MNSESTLDRLSISKRTSLLISAAIAAIIFVVLIVLFNTYAKTMPLVINETFNSAAEESDFDIAGAGSWQIADGAYRLTNPVSAAASPTGNINASIHKTAVTAKQWRLNASAKALSTTASRDFSVIFDYVNEANYYYVNFSTAKNDGENGIFKLQNGTQTQLVALPSTIEADKVNNVEIRKDGTEIKVYRDKTYLAKAEGISPASMRVGFGSRGGAVDFDSLTVGAEGAVTNPTPTPNPEPTPIPTPTPTPTPTPNPTPTPPPSTPLPGGGRQVNVSTSEQLTAAIADAKAGDVIKLADGKYEGKKAVGKYTGSFALLTSGTADKPIYLTGSRNAVIEGGGTGGRYGLYMVGANHWVVKGITVTNATKGIVLDGGNHNMFDGIKITQTGQEGIHFRSHSSDNTIQNSEVSYTGAKNATYGEGVYIGSANSNWGTYTGGQPDKSDRNKVLNNTISFTGAENMDIKEGTTGGLIQGNTMNGAGMSGSWADSWIDVKGNNYTFRNNSGTNALLDGFQIHVAIAGWGNNNVFENNNANVGGPGYGLSVQSGASGTIWKCNNIVTNAKGGSILNGKPLACTP
jgi:hypothetical protein